MFVKKIQKLLFIASLFSSVSILGCAADENTYNYSETSKTPLLEQTTSDNFKKIKTQTKQGKLIYQEIPPGRSVRAYTREEFFLITNAENNEKLVLFPSDKVSYSQLKSFHNQNVDITAVYQKGTRPDASTVSCPIDVDGKCMIQGQGYQVLSVVTK